MRFIIKKEIPIQSMTTMASTIINAAPEVNELVRQKFFLKNFLYSSFVMSSHCTTNSGQLSIIESIAFAVLLNEYLFFVGGIGVSSHHN